MYKYQQPQRKLDGSFKQLNAGSFKQLNATIIVHDLEFIQAMYFINQCLASKNVILKQTGQWLQKVPKS